MKRLLLSVVFSLLILISPLFLGAQHTEKCLTEHMFWEAAKEDPSLIISRQLLEEETKNYILNSQDQKSSSVPKIIPVVVHVIHEGGTENISKAQIEDQIRVLNEDFRRLNPDTVNTPGPFQTVAADPNVEFRLATLDPNGNCTDGIVRVFSSLTNNARNNVKALSYWPSNKYLNFWIVKTIENTSGNPGIIAGFAQFPGSTANPLTDGVVVRSDYIGTIGTAASSNDKGRVATHEIGHWLNLRHIWGDAVCGSDFVSDTPPQEGPNQSNCPAFPSPSNCAGNNPAIGDMFTNYMDYTNGSCQNIYTAGQVARMDAAISSSVSGRNNLWTQSNLIATGTDDNAVPQLCAPVAEFWASTYFVCVGSDITYFEGAWNGDPTTYQWILPGTNLGSSSDTAPTVQYLAPGFYDVTLIVSNASGADTLTKTAFISVFSQFATRWVPDIESFENQSSFPGWEWFVYNDGGNGWEETPNAAFTGSRSIWINNFGGNISDKTDVFLTPAYNLSLSQNTFARFQLAFAVRSTTSTDQLKVYASSTCGQFWSQRLSKSGTALATAGLIQTPFTPSNTSQWRQENINLTSALFSGNPNVRLKFEYTHDTGNNIYIDDLVWDGIVGVNEEGVSSGMNIYPNPMINYARLEFVLEYRNLVKVTLHDVFGREVKVLAEDTLDKGEYHYDINDIETPGIYFIKLQTGENQTTKKIIVL